MSIPVGDSALRQVRYSKDNWTYNSDVEDWEPSRQAFQFDRAAPSELGEEEMSVFLRSGLEALGASEEDVSTRGGMTEAGAVVAFPNVDALPDRVEHCSGVAATPMAEPATIGQAHASIYRPKLDRMQRRQLHAELVAQSELCTAFERPDWPPPG